MVMVTGHRRAILALCVAVLLVLAGKAYTILEYGPLRLGDNYHYVDAADEILAGDAWLHDAGLDKRETPPTLYRPIGYSLAIAGAKRLAGDAWIPALMILQAVCSLGAGLLVLRLACACGLSLPWAIGAFLLHQWSAPLSTDAMVMEDALIGAAGTAAACLLLLPIARGAVPSFTRFLAAGVLAGMMFLFREVFHFLMPPLAVIALAMLLPRVGVWRAVIMAAALVVPVLVVSGGVKAWNEYRTGTAIGSTGGQTAYSFAIVQAMRYDPSIVAGDDPFAVALRESNQTFDYGDARRANKLLFNSLGMNSLQQAKAAEHLFWTTLRTNPLPLVRAALARLRPVQQGTLFAGPITRLDDLDWWAGSRLFLAGWRADKERALQTLDFSPRVAANLAVRLVTRVVGVVMLAAFLLGVPLCWLLLRDRLGAAASAMMISWLLYGLVLGMYLPINLEVRYLAPVLGPALVSALMVVSHGGDLRRRLAAWRR